jgi:hypothetical protein
MKGINATKIMQNLSFELSVLDVFAADLASGGCADFEHRESRKEKREIQKSDKFDFQRLLFFFV